MPHCGLKRVGNTDIFNLARKVDLPDEIWLKILRYLRTWDILLTIARLNKKFHNLANDPSAIRFLDIKTSIKGKSRNFKRYQKSLKILKHSNNLNSIKLNLSDTQYGNFGKFFCHSDFT